MGNDRVNLLSQASQPVVDVPIEGAVAVVCVLAAALVIPFLLAVGTSFLKLVVVGHILRSALGTPHVPPTIVITGLAIVLSAHIMAPTARDAYNAARQAQSTQGAGTPMTLATLGTNAKAAAGPVRAFLSRHTHASELALFARLRAAVEAGEPVTTLPVTTRPATEASDWTVLVPAFVVSELSEAFQIGFLLFVPFLVIDLVISNVLMSMGMFMLSPTTVSLPIKLLLFVLVDGWQLITKGLVLGYT